MTLKIVTPEGIIYDDQAEMIVVRTIDGDRGIMAFHEPLLTGVEIGEIKIKRAEEELLLATSHGYMEVKPEKVTILVEAAEFASEIDVDRAQAAKERAKNRLEKRQADHIDEERAEIALQKALNRLQVNKRRNFE